MLSDTWRIFSVTKKGADALTINALHLYSDAVRIDESATITCSTAPTSGAVADLTQTPPASPVVFDSIEAIQSGFYIQWQFSSPVDLNGFRIAAGLNFGLTFAALVDGLWKVRSWLGTVGVSAGALSPLTSLRPFVDATSAVLYMPGESNVDRVTGTSWTLASGAAIQAVVPNMGSTTLTQSGYIADALALAGSVSVSYPSYISALTNWTGGSIAIEARVFCTTAPVRAGGSSNMFSNGSDEASAVYWSFGPTTDGRLVFYYWSGVENYFYSAAGAMPFGKFVRIAACWQGAVLRMFVDGKIIHTATRTTTPLGSGNSQLLRIGAISAAYSALGDFAVSDLIFTPSAKYVADFDANVDLPSAIPARTSLLPFKFAATSDVSGFHTTHSPCWMARDMQYGGRGKVVGTVKQKAHPANTPLGRRVRLINERDNALVREGWSDPDTGAYEFLDVDPTLTYTVLSYDHLHNFRAVVADNLTPELMP